MSSLGFGSNYGRGDSELGVLALGSHSSIACRHSKGSGLEGFKGLRVWGLGFKGLRV